MKALIPYIQIARPDHWFKNVFMIPGILVAFLFAGVTFDAHFVLNLVLGVMAVCFIASANYTINELLDAPYDMEHPVKKFRPVPSGKIKTGYAYLQYFILIALGLGISYFVNVPFLLVNLFLLIMGVFYNVKPFRTKDLVYVDVLSESVNNSIRFLLGWFIVTTAFIPPLSIIIAYWMIGAFFMASKRLGEIRFIDNQDTVKNYRKSLSRYTEAKLITSIIFYASLFSFSSAVFLIRYKFELILISPILSLLVAEYIRISFIHNSPVQYPEKLYRQKGLMFICILLVVCFVILLFVKIPVLSEIFEPKITF
ncbi:MAG TPA: UbiA prenyltransferase family protein [Ignavibacteria bacterium]|nr:UbiA prenyltransferase family protein [Ignavibacteria bacterium]